MNLFVRISQIVFVFLFWVSCNAKLGSSISGAERKTFETLKKHALFLDSGHDKYAAFSDDEIEVLTVTNLNKSGEGSLAWAVNRQGPRIVVFEIGGVIDLDQDPISIRDPYLYIAGQTAPDPGITLIKGGINIFAHDVIIQHISVRPGDCDLPKKSGWEPDGLSTVNAYNVVIDHCSFTWAVDENLSASGARHDGPDKTSRNITFSNCIISEGLYNSTHEKGIHSMGTLIHDYCRNIAVVGNLYSHNNHRNPVLKPNAVAFIANNLVYNPKGRAIHAYWPVEEYKDYPDSLRRGKATVVGNVLIPGVDSRKDMCVISGEIAAYAEDNLFLTHPGLVSDPGRIMAKEVELLMERPIYPDKYSLIGAKNVVDHVLNHAGSRPKVRNNIDKRIINDVRSGSGKVIDSQNEVGGYPLYAPVSHSLNIPGEKIEKWLSELSDQLIQ